jgi:hypothetical protein
MVHDGSVKDFISSGHKIASEILIKRIHAIMNIQSFLRILERVVY